MSARANKLRTLRRRLEHLKKRLAERTARGEVRETGDYDAAEASALEWALSELTPRNQLEELEEVD